MNKKKIVVCGATGNQGGAVVRHLLRDPRWNVVALTRQTDQDAAIRLSQLGAEVMVADNARQASLVKAFRGAHGVFGVTQPWDAEAGHYNIQKEIIQGKNIIWACNITDIRHLVFSSIINPLNEVTGISFIDSKLVLESLVAQQGVPYTIMRTGLYMESINIPATGKRLIRGDYNGAIELPYLALRDLGRFTAEIFADTDRYLNKNIEVVGDLRSGNEIADILSDLSGYNFDYRASSALSLRLLKPELYKLRRYFEKFSRPDYHQALKVAVSNFKWGRHEVWTVAKFLETQNARGLIHH